MIPVFFVLCAAVRLARFNVQTKVVDSRYFVGLPAPMAAATIVSLLYLIADGTFAAVSRRWLEIGMLCALTVVGSLMVSTFRYLSFKKFDLRHQVSYRVAMLLAALLLVLLYRPAALLPAAALIFTLSGPLGWLGGRLRRHRPESAGELEHMETP